MDRSRPGRAPVNSPAQPPGGRGMMSIGAGVTLITAGSILRFAVATPSTHGPNIHVVGVILILAGAVGRLLCRLFGAPLTPRRNRAADYGRAAPPPTRQHFPQDQPPATDDRRVY